MKIAIDFDGSCVTHEFPKVGVDIGAQKVLKKLNENGHQLILFTMRSGKELNDAIDWFNKNNIVLYGIQADPEQHEWTSSPKCYAELYIDDAALGCPLIKESGKRAYIDWIEVEKILTDRKLFYYK